MRSRPFRTDLNICMTDYFSSELGDERRLSCYLITDERSIHVAPHVSMGLYSSRSALTLGNH